MPCRGRQGVLWSLALEVSSQGRLCPDLMLSV